MGRQWHQLHHMQIVCTLLQIGNHASTLSLNLFTGRMLLLMPNQQCQGTIKKHYLYLGHSDLGQNHPDDRDHDHRLCICHGPRNDHSRGRHSDHGPQSDQTDHCCWSDIHLHLLADHFCTQQRGTWQQSTRLTHIQHLHSAHLSRFESPSSSHMKDRINLGNDDNQY